MPSPTPRQRARAAVSQLAPDRVPLDFWARSDVTARLMEHLGVADREALYERLGIDLRGVNVGECHPEFEAKTNGVLGGSSSGAGNRFIFHDDGSHEDAWGVIRRQGAAGLYDEWVGGPFVATTDLDGYDWPTMDIYDPVDVISERVAAYGGKYAVLGNLNLPFKSCWHLRGLESFLCDMLVDTTFARELFERVAAYEQEKGMRLVAAGVDIIGIYGDIAMQDRMLVTPRAWRELEKPILKRMVEAFKRENPEVLIFYHSDGDTSEVMPDLIDIGIEIINPIQPECMDPAEVKRAYGDRLTMHGTISIQQTLPNGTVDDVRREVQERVPTCGVDGGLIICPANLMQNDTPLENIVALYDAVLDW